MNLSAPEGLKPRKSPRQARSEATVAAIFQATIQVLLTEGAQRLTTTRVAERAGVSVGTMHRYFPHMQALLFAVLRRRLDAVADAVEAACAKLEGQPVAKMAEGLVTAYVDAKTAHAEASRAFCLVAAELDTAESLGGISKRVRMAVVGLLASAADAEFDDPPVVALTMLAAISGAVRSTFERDATPRMWRTLRVQFALMRRAYLRKAAAAGPPPGP
jgi:AcrR family transcriptional regulator